MSTKIEPFEIRIEDLFRFSDGSTVITGELVGGGNVITPCQVELLVDATLVSRIRLEAERMPGPKTPKKHRIVVTSDEVPIDSTIVKERKCLLVHR
jgi:hypothetical protein